MKTKYTLLIAFIFLIGFAILVSAQSANLMNIYLDEDDETSIAYDVELELTEGWNLVSGLLSDNQIDASSEIKKKDITAIYFYSNMDNKYLLAYPEKSPEFEEYTKKRDVCEDGICSAAEREYFETWCSADCQGELSEDIMNNINVISKERLILTKDELQPVGPPGFKEHSFKTYWDEEAFTGATASDGEQPGNCDSWGYSDMDCVVVHNNMGIGGETYNYNIFINSPNDRNPYNDNFGKAFVISNDHKVYAQVDYTDTPNVYEVAFYELADSTLKLRTEKKVPTFNEQFMSQANWVYSEKAGKIKYEAIILRLNQRNLKEGWNFVSITPDMIDVDLVNLKGNCDITKTYFYNPYDNRWDSFRLEDDFEPGMEGMGAIIKVSESCILGTSEDNVNNAIMPPQIPTD
ncbi:MAG: hypothetical protein KJ600_03205 [Nanoarchaeota archaeon]|nr:hypothetical protein [Nanoarchaeota archaeon]MBU1103535.1 hypothetical protein [Nanoarchaeota archaeon]